MAAHSSRFRPYGPWREMWTFTNPFNRFNKTKPVNWPCGRQARVDAIMPLNEQPERQADEK